MGRNVFPEERSAGILKKLILDVSEYLGEIVNTIVVTVPAYFNEAQRQATKDANFALDIYLNQKNLIYLFEKKISNKIFYH